MVQVSVLVIIFSVIGFTLCCSPEDECTIPESTCTDGACVCRKGFILSSDQSACLPYVTEYNGVCSENAQCEWLGANSQCNYVCRCNEGYRWFLGECKQYVGLGESCSVSSDCYDGYNLLSLTCTNNKCSCSEGYYQRGDTDCRKIAPNEGDICALHIDCKANHSVCHLGRCAVNNIVPTLEEKIIEEFAVLEQSITPTECETNEDCNEIPHSECYDKTGQCVCSKKYFFAEDACIPELGVDAGCTVDSDCLLKPGQCVDGACYCRDYYFNADGNRQCVKTFSQNNWNCLSKEWCYALGPYAYCNSDETCNCSQGSDLNEEQLVCTLNGEQGPECTEDYQCKYIQNGYCVNEKCGCQKDYVLYEDNRCVPDIGAVCNDEIKCEIENSLCFESHCQCIEGYVAYEKKGCYIKSEQLGDECEVDVQCSDTVLYSTCMETKCDCDLFHTKLNNLTCYPKRELGDYCNNKLECSLSLNEVDDSIVCRNHKCQCPTDLMLRDSKCSSSQAVKGSLVIAAMLLILKNLYSVS